MCKHNACNLYSLDGGTFYHLAMVAWRVARGPRNHRAAYWVRRLEAARVNLNALYAAE
jgi:hypothetical protein